MDSSLLLHGIKGSIKLSVNLMLIIVPLTIAYEMLENSKVFQKILDFMYKLIRPLGFSKEASVSMIVGVFLGIAYGSGILLAQSEKKKLTGLDIILTAVFLSMCHAIIEDTLIFVVIGANGFYIIAARLIMAIIMTYLFYIYLKSKVR